MDVVAWLRGLRLERYASAFRDNDIDGEVLPELTSDDLISIGVTSVGHRRKLLAAIASLAATPPAATVIAEPRDAPAAADAERRQLTVMFCDLVGSTELSSRLDPEDLREVIAAYHRAVADVVGNLDGFVTKYMGDGVLIYFGYPRAHEDDAERAVRAGLDVVYAVARLEVKSVKLQARVGIATGLVVVGDLIGEGSAQEQSVVGETPNLAARLQALAEPNTVVIAPSTRRPLRIPRSRCHRGQRHRCAGPGVASAAAERRREPFRGFARLGADPVDRPRRGDRAVAASLGAR
jgi:class 3 adenylate cyclase